MYKTIFEKSVDGILVLEDSAFVYCNQASVEMFAYKNKSQLLKLTPSEISPEFQPDGMASSIKSKQMIDLCFKKGGHRFEWVHQKANKETFWTEIVLSDISEGATTRVLAILRHIETEKIQKKEIKKLNKKLKESLSLMDKHIISSSTDLNGIITEVSEAFCKISKYSKEELIGKAHNIIRHPDVDSQIYKEMWEALKNDQVWTGVVKNRAKDNSTYWADSIISPIYVSTSQTAPKDFQNLSKIADKTFSKVPIYGIIY
ncbi:MAG: PAS domain S-box protein, partial [Sulfurimonas sp.]